MPPSTGEWVRTHIAETDETVIRQEIAEYTQVHGMNPAAKH